MKGHHRCYYHKYSCATQKWNLFYLMISTNELAFRKQERARQLLGKVISFSKQTPVKICRFPIKIASGFISCFNFFFFYIFQVLLHLSGRLAFLQVRLFPDLSILTCLFFLYFLYYPNASLGPCGSYWSCGSPPHNCLTGNVPNYQMTKGNIISSYILVQLFSSVAELSCLQQNLL